MLLTALLVFGALFALLWVVTAVAQGYFYQQPVDRLPLRAAAAALLIGGYLTFWVALDRKSPGKYDTFFEFAPYSTTTFDEFDAVGAVRSADNDVGEMRRVLNSFLQFLEVTK